MPKTRRVKKNKSAKGIKSSKKSKNKIINLNDIIDSFHKTIHKNNNYVVSVLSVIIVLMMLYNGLDGMCLSEFKKVLPLSNEHLKYKLSQLKTDKSLLIANSIWIKSDLEFKESYIKTIKKYFFTTPNILKKNSDINKWCAENTNNLISKIVDEKDKIDIALINAIYFKGKWVKKFKKSNTYKQLFYSNKNQKVDMMHITDTFKYYEDKHNQYIKLNYEEDDLAAVIILPKTGLSQPINYNWNHILKQLWTLKIEFSMPKFYIKSEYDLIPYTKKLGLKEIYSNLNIKNMISNPKKMVITQFKQKS